MIQLGILGSCKIFLKKHPHCFLKAGGDFSPDFPTQISGRIFQNLYFSLPDVSMRFGGSLDSIANQMMMKYQHHFLRTLALKQRRWAVDPIAPMVDPMALMDEYYAGEWDKNRMTPDTGDKMMCALQASMAPWKLWDLNSEPHRSQVNPCILLTSNLEEWEDRFPEIHWEPTAVVLNQLAKKFRVPCPAMLLISRMTKKSRVVTHQYTNVSMRLPVHLADMVETVYRLRFAQQTKERGLEDFELFVRQDHHIDYCRRCKAKSYCTIHPASWPSLAGSPDPGGVLLDVAEYLEEELDKILPRIACDFACYEFA